MAVIGELATLITARTEPFTKGLKVAGVQAQAFTQKIEGTFSTGFGKINSVIGRTGSLLAGIGLSVGAGSIVKKSLELATHHETMQTAFATYLKDMGKAKTLMAQLNQYSGATPFKSDEVLNAGKQLLAFGFEAQSIMQMVQTIGELAAGSQSPMADFVDILGKIKASGVASMGDINRLADRGVPIFQELAKTMGVATSEVRDLVGTGKVGFADVYNAINRVTTGTGLFSGSVAALAETTAGKLSTLSDTFDSVMRDVGSSILSGLDLNSLVTQITELVSRYKQDIIDVTVQGVKLINRAIGGMNAGWDQWDMAWALNDMIGAKIGTTYYGAVAQMSQFNKALGGGGMTPEARQRLLYYNEKYGEAQRAGIEAYQRASERIPLVPGQRGYQDQQREEKMLELISEQKRLQVGMLQELVRQNQMQAQQQQQGMIVDEF